MNDSNNVEDLKSLKDSKPLKICYWFTNFTYYLSFVSLFLICAVAVFNLSTGRNIKYMQLPVEVTYDNVTEELPLDQSNSGRYIPVVGFNNITLDISNAELMVYNLWIPLILIIGLIYILYLFRLFLQTVRFKSPFAPENPARLKRIGYFVVASGPIVGILKYIYAKSYIHYINLPGASIDIEFEVYPYIIFLGLMIVVISQVFEIAVNMKIEQDLTV